VRLRSSVRTRCRMIAACYWRLPCAVRYKRNEGSINMPKRHPRDSCFSSSCSLCHRTRERNRNNQIFCLYKHQCFSHRILESQYSSIQHSARNMSDTWPPKLKCACCMMTCYMSSRMTACTQGMGREMSRPNDGRKQGRRIG
jgi:hypothetical protein